MNFKRNYFFFVNLLSFFKDFLWPNKKINDIFEFRIQKILKYFFQSLKKNSSSGSLKNPFAVFRKSWGCWFQEMSLANTRSQPIGATDDHIFNGPLSRSLRSFVRSHCSHALRFSALLPFTRHYPRSLRWLTCVLTFWDSYYVRGIDTVFSRGHVTTYYHVGPSVRPSVRR